MWAASLPAIATPAATVTRAVPSSGKVTVPDLVGKTQDEATQALYKAHLSISVTYERTGDGTKQGKVISVPDQGKKVDNGTAVVVVVGQKPEATVTATPSPTSTPSSSSSSSSSSSAPAEGTLASDEALQALRDKLTGGGA